MTVPTSTPTALPSAAQAMDPMPGGMWRWETATRYYMAWMQRNLWGELELARVWGGKASAQGRVRFDVVADDTQGQRLLLRLQRQRQRRGYVRVLPPPDLPQS